MSDAATEADPQAAVAPAAAAPAATPTDGPSATAADAPPQSMSSEVPSAPITETLSALSSMWSGWMTQANTAAATTAATPTADTVAAVAADATAATAATAGDATTATTAEKSVTDSAATTASDFLQGAGKIFQAAVSDVQATLQGAAENINQKALDDQVDVLRQKSGQLMGDVTRGVQTLNLSLQSQDIQKSAEMLSSSTLQLFDKASQSIKQSGMEAMEIFVDDNAGGANGAAKNAPPPWDVTALPENERVHADALRHEMLKIVVDAIYSRKQREKYFLNNSLDVKRFDFELSAHTAAATAALDADRNMRRLRAGLVPAKMLEEEFWKTYFFHVHRVRQALLANGGVMPEVEGDGDDDDADALFGDDADDDELAVLDDGQETASGTKASATITTGASASKTTDVTAGDEDAEGGERNWENEIDAAFNDDDENAE